MRRALEDVVLSHHSLGELPLPVRLEAAASAGFRQVGLSVRRAVAWLAGRDLGALVDLLDRVGLVVAELEVVSPLGPEPDPLQDSALAMAVALGGPRIQVVAPVGPPRPVGRVESGRLGDLVAAAADRGSTVMLEFMPFSAVPSLPAALDVARRIEGLTVCVDAWHLQRSGGLPADVAAVADLVGALQLCDGPLASELPEDLEQDCRTRRLLPGTGQFDLSGLLAAAPAAPLSVEVASSELHALEPHRASALVAGATADLLHVERDPAEHHRVEEDRR